MLQKKSSYNYNLKALKERSLTVIRDGGNYYQTNPYLILSQIFSVENKKTDRSNTEFDNDFDYIQEVKAIESLSIQDKELELIKKSLEKHKGKRKVAAKELGISERTLYRKIKQFNL